MYISICMNMMYIDKQVYLCIYVYIIYELTWLSSVAAWTYTMYTNIRYVHIYMYEYDVHR